MPHYILGFALGLLGLLVSLNLYRRVRSAWIITIVVQFVILRLNFISTQRFLVLVHSFHLSFWLFSDLLIVILVEQWTVIMQKGSVSWFHPLVLAFFNTLLSLSF